MVSGSIPQRKMAKTQPHNKMQKTEQLYEYATRFDATSARLQWCKCQLLFIYVCMYMLSFQSVLAGGWCSIPTDDIQPSTESSNKNKMQ